MNYLRYLEESARIKNSIVCMGLDFSYEHLPAIFKKSKESALGFRPFLDDLIIEMGKRNVYPAAVKPNQGFYAIHGSDGLQVLDCIINDIYSWDIPIILDYKRGDIGPSSANYGKEGFDIFHADAVTISPYMGTDSVEPFLKYCLNDKGVYILNRTSNPGAKDFQNLELKDGRFLYEAVAEKIIEWSKIYPGTGAVVGATSLEELSKLATMFAPHNIPLLIPGVGKQGGSAKEVVAVLRAAGYPLYLARINSSSGLTHPWASKKEEAPKNYAKVCINELQKMNEEIGPIF